MKHVVIFSKNEYTAMCTLLIDAKKDILKSPDHYYRMEALNKLNRLQEILEGEDDE